MKIIHAKTFVGYGVTNIDIYRVPDGEDLADAVTIAYDDLRKRIKAKKLNPGDKYTCDIAEFNLFQGLFETQVEVRPLIVTSPGGSILNTMCAVGKSSCGLQPQLVSYIGNGQAAPQIREVCRDNLTDLFEIPISPGYNGPINIPKNLVFMPPEGERILLKGPSGIVKYAFDRYGFTHAFDQIGRQRSDVIEQGDIVFVQGASIMRLGMKYLGAKLDLLKQYPDKLVVFSLPTVNEYGEDFRRNENGKKPRIERIKDFVFQNTFILSSTKGEFNALFDSDFDEGLRALQNGWRSHPHPAYEDPRLALITDGSKGAVLVIEGEGWFKVDPRHGIKEAHKVGAGDATLAGFIAGLKVELPAKLAAKLAMDYGAIKAAQKEMISVIADPIRSLLEIGGEAANAYLKAVEHRQGAPRQPSYRQLVA